MTHLSGATRNDAWLDAEPSFRRVSPVAVLGAVVLALGGLAGAVALDGGAARLPSVAADLAVRLPALAAWLPAPDAPSAAGPGRYAVLLDPELGGRAAVSLERSAPLPARFVGGAVPAAVAAMQPAAAAPAVVVAQGATMSPATADAGAAADAVLPLPRPVLPAVVASAPLPVPRPGGLDVADAAEAAAPAETPPFRTARRFARRARVPAVVAAATAPPADNRGFFEKLFGGFAPPPGPRLAYAAPEEGVVADSLRNLAPAPRASLDRYTAVYDIAAHTVTLPDGTRLEAHSGLGPHLDDPRFVHVRMRGPTPPALYNLTEREALFHGVRALRLSPAGGNGVFGRVGLLAHTYMLGPNGDSNGCVSFRNYDSFLQAFLRGDVKRLAVVARS